MRLSHYDYEACAHAVREIYARAAMDAFPQMLLPSLARLIPADYLTANVFDPEKRSFIIHFHPERPEIQKLLAQFTAHFHEHPLSGCLVQVEPVPIKLSDVVSVRQFTETGIYQEYYRHTGLRHQLVFFMQGNTGARDGFSFGRHSRDFSERDRAILAFLGPHLIQAGENARAASKAARSLEGIGEGFGAMNRAALVVERDGDIRWQSPLAREWLAEFSLGTPASGQLPPALNRALRESRKLAAHARAASSEFAVSSPSGHRFVVNWGKAADGSFALSLIRERMNINPVTAARFELTRREAEILHWITEAKTNQEITSTLGVSGRTTEKHIENLFAKLKVQSRVEAQRLGWELRRA